MRLSIRTLSLLLALMLALVALPSVVMAASGHALSASMAAAFGVEQDGAENNATNNWQPARHGTVPPPTPRPIPPQPVPPAPRPPQPAPVARTASRAAVIGTYIITKVIGDRLSPTVYAYTNNNRLYRSDDDGRTWQLVATNPPVGHFVMSAVNPDILYSGSGPNCAAASATLAPMYKSTDGGFSWSELTTGLDLKPLLIDPSNAEHVFAADCSTLYLSTDGGMTWSPKPEADAEPLWQTYAVTAMASASLVNTTTPHWSELFAAGNDGLRTGVVAFSGDQGGTWANISSASDTWNNVTALTASLDKAGTLWVVDSQGVWSTADYGVNWSLSNEGLRDLLRMGASFNDVTYSQGGRVYLATDYGMFVQNEPGAAWVRPDVSFGGVAMKSLLLTESNPRRLWINGEDRGGNPTVFLMTVD